MIEDSKEKAYTFKGLKRKNTAPGYKGKDQEDKNKRFKKTFYIYNKEGYKANEFHSHPKKNKKDEPQANMTDHVSPSLSGMVSELNLSTNNKDWWVDNEATQHICSEKILFVEHQKLKYDEQLFMGNSDISKVEGKENVILKWTSGKEL